MKVIGLKLDTKNIQTVTQVCYSKTKTSYTALTNTSEVTKLVRHLQFINRSYRVLKSVCVSLCLSVCVSVCSYVCVDNNSKNNELIKLKAKHIVIFENSSDEFNVVHCPIKIMVNFEIFLHLQQYKLSSPISQLWQKVGKCELT